MCDHDVFGCLMPHRGSMSWSLVINARPSARNCVAQQRLYSSIGRETATEIDGVMCVRSLANGRLVAPDQERCVLALIANECAASDPA
jgi:hypothetical protein